MVGAVLGQSRTWGVQRVSDSVEAFGSFLRSPIVAPRADALRAAHATHAIYGIPFDSTTMYRTGSRHGPHAIRDASAQFLAFHFDFGIDLATAIGLVDCGDAAVVAGNARRTLERAQADLTQLYKAGVMPIIFGGEHSVTIAGTAALAQQRRRPLGLVVFDTHLDTAAAVDGETLSYCASVSRTLEMSEFSSNNTCLIGIHGPTNPPDQVAWAEEQGVRVYSMDEVEKRGICTVTHEAMQVAWRNADGVYVSVDIDCLDAAYAPGTSGPEPGGLTTRELLAAMREVALSGFSAFDVVEVAPQYDPAGITAAVACRLVLDVLAARARSCTPG
jgi:agmatinase